MSETGDAQIGWSAALLALLVSHAGWGCPAADRPADAALGDFVGRQALARDSGTYTPAFTPALAWIGRGAARALTVSMLVAGPHLVIAVDQCFQVLSLVAAVRVAAR